LLLLACGLALIGDLVTIFVNVPINNRLASWDPAALPPDYQDYLRRRWEWHHVRLVPMFTAMCLVFAAPDASLVPRGITVRALDVSRWLCHHRAILSAEPWTDHSGAGLRVADGVYHLWIIGADARPNWSEKASQ
jgi:hypothetical protein